MLVYLFSLYLREYELSVFNDYRKLFLLAALVAVSVLGLKIGTNVLGLKINSPTVGYLNTLWIATAAEIEAYLFDALAASAIQRSPSS